MADRKRDAEAVEIGPPPPMAQNVQISVYRGESITIPLTARGRVPLDTRFLIRSRPRAGELSGVVMEGPGRGTVTYRHGGGEAPAEDVFTYAAQAGDSAVSAPARVRIFVLERPAELVVPESIDFGRGLLGVGEDRWITLANAGGATFRADLQVDAGWELPGEKTVEIPGGEAVRLQVRFQPEQERSYLGALRFSHDEKVMIRLSGEGVEPVRWFPQRMAWTGADDEAETQDLVIENRSGEAIAVRLEAGEGIFLAEEVAVAAGETQRVAVQVDRERKRGARGIIRLRHPFGEAEIPFQVAAVPARLELEPPGWNLGEVRAGEEVEQELVVRNVGGVATVVALTPPIGIEVEGALDRPLPPDGEERFLLRFQARTSGAYERELEIRHGGSASPWPVRAFVQESEAVSAREQGRSTSFLPTASPTPKGPEIFPLQDLEATGRTKNTVGFEWTQEIPSEDRLVVEERLVGVAPGGGLAINWRTTEQIQLTRMPDHRWRATVVGLPPGGRKYLRVHWQGPDGTTQGYSEMLAVQAESTPPGHGFPWRSLILLLLAGAAVWIWWRGRQKGDPETEARLRNLEKGP
jgi:hypothetical protein